MYLSGIKPSFPPTFPRHQSDDTWTFRVNNLCKEQHWVDMPEWKAIHHKLCNKLLRWIITVQNSWNTLKLILSFDCWSVPRTFSGRWPKYLFQSTGRPSRITRGRKGWGLAADKLPLHLHSCPLHFAFLTAALSCISVRCACTTWWDLSIARRWLLTPFRCRALREHSTLEGLPFSLGPLPLLGLSLWYENICKPSDFYLEIMQKLVDCIFSDYWNIVELNSNFHF